MEDIVKNKLNGGIYYIQFLERKYENLTGIYFYTQDYVGFDYISISDSFAYNDLLSNPKSLCYPKFIKMKIDEKTLSIKLDRSSFKVRDDDFEVTDLTRKILECFRVYDDHSSMIEKLSDSKINKNIRALINSISGGTPEDKVFSVLKKNQDQLPEVSLLLPALLNLSSEKKQQFLRSIKQIDTNILDKTQNRLHNAIKAIDNCGQSLDANAGKLREHADKHYQLVSLIRDLKELYYYLENESNLLSSRIKILNLLFKFVVKSEVIPYVKSQISTIKEDLNSQLVKFKKDSTSVSSQGIMSLFSMFMSSRDKLHDTLKKYTKLYHDTRKKLNYLKDVQQITQDFAQNAHSFTKVINSEAFTHKIQTFLLFKVPQSLPKAMNSYDEMMEFLVNFLNYFTFPDPMSDAKFEKMGVPKEYFFKPL